MARHLRHVRQEVDRQDIELNDISKSLEDMDHIHLQRLLEAIMLAVKMNK